MIEPLLCQGDRSGIIHQYAVQSSGLNLLVATIILWNTRYLKMALADIVTPDALTVNAMRHDGSTFLQKWAWAHAKGNSFPDRQLGTLARIGWTPPAEV